LTESCFLENTQSILMKAEHKTPAWLTFVNHTADPGSQRDSSLPRPRSPTDERLAASAAVLSQAITCPVFRCRTVVQGLGRAGYRDLQPSPAHVLLSIRHDKSLILDSGGSPALRLFKFRVDAKSVGVKPNSITASGP
jgi:hypothetical protein